MSNGEADRDAVNQALARLLAWPDIARSPQLANFLTYIVERRLDGQAHGIKAYSIAVDVFSRPQDFDPQADPIVRVQARRLRGLLDQYYRGPGADDPLRIELPIGRYVPEFVDADRASSSVPIGGEPSVTPEPTQHLRPRGHVTLSWFVLLVLTLGAVALTYSLATWGPRRDHQVVATGAMQMPRLRIMEFQNLTGDTALTPTIAALAVELVNDFDPLLIVEASFGGRNTVDPDTVDTADFVLSGVVRTDTSRPDGYQFNAILTEAASNSVVWNWSATVGRDQIVGRGGIDYVSQELILRLGGPRGPLHAKARALLARTDITGQENFYLCAILFSMYRTAPTSGTTARLNACLNALPEALQANGNVLAARASVLAESISDGAWASENQRERYKQAGSMLAQALQVAPTSSFVWEQQARLHEGQGAHEETEAAYGTALQLNPANIDGTAGHARHMALIGRLTQALPAARRAIDAVPPLEVPNWFQCVPAMGALADGSFDSAQRLALQCGRVDIELGPILALMAADSANDAETLGRTLPSILEVPTFRSTGIMTRLEHRITDAVLLTRIEETLRKAGVPEKNLVSAF